jgi:hypothetical protein
VTSPFPFALERTETDALLFLVLLPGELSRDRPMMRGAT